MKGIFRTTLCWALLSFASVSLMSSTLEDGKPISLEDLGLEADLSDPRISPDGQTVVVVVRRPDYDENRFQNQLILVNVADGTKRPLTFDRHRVRLFPDNRRELRLLRQGFRRSECCRPQ